MECQSTTPMHQPPMRGPPMRHGRVRSPKGPPPQTTRSVLSRTTPSNVRPRSAQKPGKEWRAHIAPQTGMPSRFHDKSWNTSSTPRAAGPAVAWEISRSPPKAAAPSAPPPKRKPLELKSPLQNALEKAKLLPPEQTELESRRLKVLLEQRELRWLARETERERMRADMKARKQGLRAGAPPASEAVSEAKRAVSDTAAQAVLDAVLALAAARSANAEAKGPRPAEPAPPPKDETARVVDDFLAGPIARTFAAPADDALDAPLWRVYESTRLSHVAPLATYGDDK